MRTIPQAGLVLTAIILLANPAWSKSIGAASEPLAAPLTRLAGDYDDGGGYHHGGGGYHHGCGYGYHYVCWYDDYGRRHCGCRH